MKNVKIGVVVRIYDEQDGYEEMRYNNVSHEHIPADIMEKLVSGEVIGVNVIPNVKAFYFKVPTDWPDTWTTLKNSRKSSISTKIDNKQK